MLREQERLQSLVRRYQAPDEYPFFPSALQEPILQPIDYPKILHSNDVNVNPQLKSDYIAHILPAACANFEREERGETKENYGSAATCDVLCLQALSRRIHFGKFVAESKFQSETERFVKMIKEEDRKGIDDAITNKKVEEKVLERLRLKAKTYGTDPSIEASSNQREEGKIHVEAVVTMYKVSLFPPLLPFLFILFSLPFPSSFLSLFNPPHSPFLAFLLTIIGLRHTAHKGRRGGISHAATQRHRMGVTLFSHVRLHCHLTETLQDETYDYTTINCKKADLFTCQLALTRSSCACSRKRQVFRGRTPVKKAWTPYVCYTLR